jgi:hypothetical protein
MPITLTNADLVMDLVDPRADHDQLGSRYSHSGYIRQVRLQGVPVFAMPRRPFQVFHGRGFPAEFETPVGYTDAAVGEPFLKLGVGRVVKVAPHAYTNWDEHPVVAPADHHVSTTAASAVFHQSSRLGDWAYDYRTQIELVAANAFVVGHTLANTGTAAWQTSWYSHAFLDRALFADPLRVAPGPGWQPAADNDLTADGAACALPPVGRSNGEEGLCYHWQRVAGGTDSHGVSSARAVFAAAADYEPAAFMVYANEHIVSPEPRRHLDLVPGQSTTWRTTYRVDGLTPA